MLSPDEKRLIAQQAVRDLREAWEITPAEFDAGLVIPKVHARAFASRDEQADFARALYSDKVQIGDAALDYLVGAETSLLDALQRIDDELGDHGVIAWANEVGMDPDACIRLLDEARLAETRREYDLQAALGD